MTGVPIPLGKRGIAQPVLGLGTRRLDAVLLGDEPLERTIAMGASIEPRRHASSHGAAHTRPQTDANGFGARATR
jgi:hypothetical protein